MTAIATSYPAGTLRVGTSRVDAPSSAQTSQAEALHVGIAAFTLARLLLVPAIAVAFSRSQLLVALLLAIFIAADLFDGVIARAKSADGVRRRTLDSIVDRMAIWPVFIVVSLAGYLSPALVAALVARDLYCAYWCGRIVRERHTAIRADWPYRTLNVLLAAWVVTAPIVGADLRSLAFGGILAFGCLVSADLTRSCRAILAAPRSTAGGRVISAGQLRRSGSGAERALLSSR